MFILFGYTIAWDVPILAKFPNLDRVARSQVCQKYTCTVEIVLVNFCPLLFKQYFLATHMEKIMHNMLCVIGMYLRERIKTYPPPNSGFARES